MKLSGASAFLMAVALHTSNAARRDRAVSTPVSRPVSKVINLLKDMLGQLEADSSKDQEIYDKLACWCETNEKEKTKSIKDAKTKLGDLASKIEEYTATSKRLASEIKTLEGEVATNQEALEKATAIRQEQLAEFNGEETDLLEAISALKAAIVVLSKHHSTSLLQMPIGSIQGVAAALRLAMQKRAVPLQGMLTPSEQRAATAFIQNPTFNEQYSAGSGEILGILKQMKDTFEASLSASQKGENGNQGGYEQLKAAKESEIAAGRSQIDAKTGELAETDENNAHAKQDVEDTKASLAADEEFLEMLKAKCASTDEEWEERQRTRSQEIAAVTKALAFLSSDDAHDLFAKVFNGFVQKQSSASSNRRAEASRVLSSVAGKLHSSRLAALASRVRLDAFEKVKSAIDNMVSELLTEKADEIKKKDYCNGQFNENQLGTEKKEFEKKELEAKHDDLTSTAATLTSEVKSLEAEVSEMRTQMKRAGEDREKENDVFQKVVQESRATQRVLEAALGALKGFYEKDKRAAAMMQKQPAGPPPPPGFEDYKDNSQSGNVLAMISEIISDAKKEEMETLRSEEDAQLAYESFVKETNRSVDRKNAEIASKTQRLADTKLELTNTNKDLESTTNELEQLAKEKADLHAACDFVLLNFDIRQKARDEEVQALREAKAILSGMKLP